MEDNTNMNELPNDAAVSLSCPQKYSPHEKLQIAQKYCNDIVKIMVQSSDSDFNAQLEILKSVKQKWNQKRGVQLVLEEEKNNDLDHGTPILSSPIKLKGRPRDDMKTTSGYFCRRRSKSHE